MESWDENIADIVDETISGKIDPSSAADKLTRLCLNDEKKDFLLDYVWIESYREHDEAGERVQEMVGRLVDSNTLTAASVIRLLEAETIPEDIITPDSLRRKRTQAKTKRLYTIPKFNLLSECAEGFSTVTDIAWCLATQALDADDITLISKKVKEAIGRYSLCPNKALVILVSMLSWVSEDASRGDALVEVIAEVFPKERVTSVMSFHLLSYSKADEVPSETPKTFLRAISRLSRAGLVNVAELWSVMTPSFSDIAEQVSVIVQEYEKQVEVVGRILAGTVSSGLEEEGSGDAKLSACISQVSGKLGVSQRFMLLEELIRSGQWEIATPLLNHLQNLFGIVPLAVVESLLEVFLEAIGGSVDGNFMEMEKNENEEEIFFTIFLLKFIGVYLGSSPKLLSQLFDRFAHSQEIVSRYLLPALSVTSPNPSLAAQAWERCMKGRTPAERFLIYQRWEEAYAHTFPLALVKQIETMRTRALLKRVVKTAQVGDTVSRTSHLAFAKQACCNPLIGVSYIVSNVQIHFNYNLIEPYVEVLSRVPSIAQDVTSYLVAAAMGSGKAPLHLKTASVEPWLSNLSEFTGRFFKKHPWAPLDGIMRLVAASMVKNEGGAGSVVVGRVLLEAIIQHMGGFSVVHQLNADQLESLSGGPVLNQLTQSSNTSELEGIRIAERAKLALKEALVGGPQNLVYILWVCLAHQLTDLTTSKTVAQELMVGGGLKLLGILHDGIHACLLQLTQFLSLTCEAPEYAAFLPPDFVSGQHTMDPAIAFHIMRPAAGDRNFSSIVIMPPAGVNISQEMCAAFWGLSLHDLAFPESSYRKQIKVLNEKISATEHQINSFDKTISSSRMAEDAKEQFRSARRDLARLKDILGKLEAEFSLHAQRHENISQWMRESKDRWWVDGAGNRSSTLYLVEELIAKRVTLSVQDALFCSHFVKWLAKENVLGFQFLDFMNQWTELLSQLVSCASEGEARIFSEFVLDMMKFVVDLRSDESKFNQYVTTVNPVFNRNYFSPEKGEIVPITDSELKRGHLKWESSVAKALKIALKKDSADWCEKRNCLILISKTCEAFPIIQVNASDLIKAVQELTSDSQEDIATLALSLSRRLASLEPNWLDKTPAANSADSSVGVVVERLESPADDNVVDRKPRAPVVTRRLPPHPRDESPPRGMKRPVRPDLDDYSSKRGRPDERERLTRASSARIPDIPSGPRHRGPPTRR